MPDALRVALTTTYPDIPLSTILLTAGFVYLYRLGNQDNLGVGFYTPESLKNNFPSVLSPFFAHTLPLMVQFQDDLSFADALQCVIQRCHELKTHATYDRSLWHRDPDLSNKTPYFPLTVGVTDESDNVIEPAWVTLLISTDGKQLTWLVDEGILQSDSNLRFIVRQFPAHLQTLLQAAVETPTTPISQLNWLSPAEKKKLLVTWNQTERNYPQDKTIAQLFEAQVNQTPHHVAVVYGNQQLTYEELNRRANQMARYFEKKGLAAGERILICREPDEQRIVSLLAILKLDATFISIDPQSPLPHLQSILDDSKPSFVITNAYQGDFKAGIFHSLHDEIIDLDTCQMDTRQEDSCNLDRQCSVKNPACIIYTSGTTGKPKGVIIRHQAVARLVKNTNYIQISEQDRLAQAASINFDASLFEIWGALLNGACLVCVHKDTLLNPLAFAHFLTTQCISILWLTSALFDQYALADPSMFKRLTYLLVGGDVLNRDTIQAVLECPQGHPQYVLNGYGPTENTTFTTTHPISQASIRRQRIPIGKPIANTTVYVLDQHLNPVPIGIPGELYVGGNGLSQGYLNQPALTQEKFINNPFGTTFDRLYKTGDRVCWLACGHLDYLGRKDNQVKIRGFRIELEALQADLLRYEPISQCFIRLYEHEKRGKYLVAYLVARDAISFDQSQFKKWLNHHLPDYMIPSHVMLLDKLPLTQNGKVDARSLPIPTDASFAIQTNYHPPKTEREKKLAQIWCDLFSLEKISTEDNFFSLGGNSLLLTQLILKLKKSLKIELSINDFLKTPTIRYLARLGKEKKLKPSINRLPDQFLQDMELTACLTPDGSYPTTPITQAILLTGATGFLGIHLLGDLLRASSAKLYCLIRSDSTQNAMKTLEALINQYHLNVEIKNRVVPLIGDLAQPYLGLTSYQFDFLAEEIDCIYHNGAYVHHLYNYAMLRAANVLGTVELLKLAAFKKNKPFYYISTLSAVIEHVNTKGLIREDFVSRTHLPYQLQDGYNQTKWVAEYLVADAHRKGLSVKVYRPNWILGQSATGSIAAEKNHLWLLIKGCIQMGVAPNWKTDLSILPVDFVSHFIVSSSIDYISDKKVFNLANTHLIKWIDLIDDLNQFGYKIDVMDARVWQEKHLNHINKNNALFHLVSLYRSVDCEWTKNLGSTCYAEDLNTQTMLKQFGLNYSLIDKHLLHCYFDYLIKNQFLPQPLRNAIIYPVKENPMKRQSKRKHLKKAKDQFEKHLEMLANCMPGNFYWKDRAGKYVGCNGTLLKTLGFRTSLEIIGKTDADLWLDQAGQLRHHDEHVMKSGKPISLEEIVDLPLQGQMHFAVIKTPWINDDGEVVGIIGNSLDITELKDTQKKLDEAKQKAERLSKAKTSFLVNMSHDIKTPIAGIMGLADMLRGQLQGEALEYVEDIYASATQSMAFFNHCLDLMKSDEVESLLVKEPFRLQEVCEQIQSLFQAAVKDKKLAFRLYVDPKIPDYLLGSYEAVYRILMNLVGNAIKFTKEGQVSVVAKLGEQSTEKNKVIKFSVKDTGIGIPKDQQRAIFEAFTRLHPSSQGLYEGKGIGLFEIKQLVKGLGGEIKVHSEEGKGSEFIIVISLDVPMLNPQEYEPTIHEKIHLRESANKPQPAPQSQMRGGDQLTFEKTPPKILLVEDDKIAQTVVSKLLSNLSCEMDLAVNGGSALDQFVPGKYDLVLMDLGLPDMMGDEIAKQMRTQEQGSGFHVPIIAVTAHPLPPTIEECRVAGMEGVLSKPLSQKQAVQLIERYVNLKPVVVEGLDAFDALTTTPECEGCL